MALVVKDRVKETTSSTGTGTITLAGAVSGFQSFSVIGDGNTTYYTITNNVDWEVGIGTYTSSGTTLSRDTILESSNGGAAVNFGAGTKDVFVTYPAEKSISDGYGTLPVANGGTGVTTSTGTGSVVLSTSPTLTTPNLGTPSAATLTNATGLPIVAGTTGTLSVARGGTGATTAPIARTNLGATTVGGNLFTLTNPSAITFPRFNADNTVSALNAADFRTAIGAGTGDGTVNSVAATAGTGISVTGSPITTSGTLTITNTAPDQVVSLTGAGTTSITGTYPNFTITSNDQFSGTVTSVAASGGNTGLTFSGSPITTSGTLTLGGTLAVANGGTGNASWATGALISFSSPTNANAIVPGTPNHVLITGGTGTIPYWGQVSLGSAVRGTLPSGNGGTGFSTYTTGDLICASATNTLAKLPIGASGYVLTSNGTHVSWQPAAGGGVTSFSAGTTGLTPNTATTGAVTLAGTLAIAYGGTGQTTKAAAFNALTPTTALGDLIYANGAFSNTRLPIGTTGYYLKSNGSTPSWQPLSVAAGNITGTIQINQGGTGTTTYPSSGQLLIGTSASSYQVATLTAGSGITITNGSGSITIAASGGGGGPYITYVQFVDGGFYSSNFGQGPTVFYNAGTNHASFWFYSSNYMSFGSGSSISQIDVQDNLGNLTSYYSGPDFSSGSWYAANNTNSVAGVYGISIFNSTLQTLLANTAAQLTSPALAPGNDGIFNTHASLNAYVSGGINNSYFSYPYPIAVTSPAPTYGPGSYEVIFYSNDTTSDFGLSLFGFEVYDETGMFVGNFSSAGGDFVAVDASNSFNGAFRAVFSSVSNATLQAVLDNSIIT